MKLHSVVRMFKYVPIRYIFVVSLMIFFAWCASQDFLRYWSQPLITDISYSFGDNKNGIQFPHIAFCPYFLVRDNSVLNECYNGSSWSFITALFECLKYDENFNIESFMTTLKKDRETLRAKALFWTGQGYIDLNNLNEYHWSPLFHPKYGPCYSFDLSKEKEFKFIEYQGNQVPGIEFIIPRNVTWHDIVVILHSKNDFSDAWMMNGYFKTSISNEKFKSNMIRIRKKISKRESTRIFPCSKYEEETRRNIEDNKKVLSKFKCRMSILYQGHHLDHLFPENISTCPNSMIEDAIDLFMDKRNENIPSQTCERIEYTGFHYEEKSYIENETLVYVSFENTQVEFHNTYISYVLLSLIGEVGGILGLTLGASVMTSLDFILQKLPYY